MSRNLIKLFGLFVAVFFGIAGCGGGSSGTTAPTTPGGVSAATVSGTASEGRLITGKAVKLKDAYGNSAADAITNATTGIYSMDVTGLTAPFLVTVTGTNGTYLSLAQAAGTANINPITTAIVALAAGNPDVVALFTNLTAAQMSTINRNYTAKRVLVATSLQSVLPAGVQMQDYFTGTITAGTGMDAIFDTHQIAVDPGAGITVKTKGAGAAAVLNIPAAAVTANMGSVLAGTVLNSLNSPVVAALASKYGQTSRTTLDSLSTTDLEQVVRAAFAVAVDLSAMTPASVAADPLIQTALRIGIPLVFENKAALKAYLSSLTGLPGGFSTADLEAAAAAMSAAIGIGLKSQVAVVMPSYLSADRIRVTEVFSLGAGAEQASLPAGTLDIRPLAATTTTDINKLLLPSTAAPPLTGPAELLAMIESAISQGLSRRSAALVSAKQASKRAALEAAATKPALITQKDFIIRWPEYVWYPRNRSQDFVIQCSVRVQMFSGSGGSKKWVRFIFDDTDGTTGFLNRGALVFKDRDDKGYFMSGAQIQVTTNANWVTFGDRSPGYADSMPSVVSLVSYSPPLTETSTSFDIDYVENGVTKNWTSTEKRQFDMSEYQLRTYSGVDFRWSLMTVSNSRYDTNIERVSHRLDRSHDSGQWRTVEQDFTLMCGDADYTPYESDNVYWPMRIARGTDQASLHPRVQAYYWVPSNETRTAEFDVNLSQEVWNVWSETNGVYTSDYRNVYSVNIGKSILVDFGGNFTVNAPLWATNTSGNPGACKVMQSDGNLVIKSSDGRALWGSGTGGNPGNPGAYVTMQSDGNLVIYSRKAVWSTNTPGNPGATKVFQNDGNLVIYSKDGRPLWASNTGGNPGAACGMQDDGNLVITSRDGRVLWASGTGGNNGATDVMQDDGNYVIYDHRALWSSGTGGNPGAYDVMQGDGNYVIYTKQ